MNKRWLSVKEFQEEFGIAQSTQAKMRKEKVLPYTKIGNFVFYDRNKIDEVFEKHCVVGSV
jgi:predicted DNA-binding transcriptional regulator AlpA